MKHNNIERDAFVTRVRGAVRSRFFWIVVVPTTIVALYFGIFASDIYVSESRFVVRSPDKQSQTGLGALLQSSALGQTQENVYVVHDFIQSRDALAELQKRQDLVGLFGSHGVDFVSRFGVFGFQRNFEGLYRYYDRRVDVDIDSTSGITTLRVNAFTAASAWSINQSLLELAEQLVNKMNARSQADLVDSAHKEEIAAEDRAQAAAAALSRYRTAEQIFDPERQSTLQLQQIARLQDSVVATQTQIAQLSAFAPDNPQLQTLKQQLKDLKKESESQMQGVAGGSQSLTKKAVEYERLKLEQSFADKQLNLAMATLESARNEALRKQLYLDVVSTPNRPDVATRPRRIKSILVAFVASLVTWGIVSLLMAGVREHHD
ncbi:capsule polysaccharide export protein [Burkholderia sp. WSM2230]|uniref:capsule polysaccharide export protein n=1 Tax=Burkholderia sp. WSM2230 TaxID=944435 RepID=UPI0004296115|nr:capsule polysaccharide export protein [Burkholderia sp. WSM2230]